MFKEEFCFFKGYKIPKVNNIDEFKEAINFLPAMDTPEVFGLHANADITLVFLFCFVLSFFSVIVARCLLL